jgi:hypothetical protein
MRRPKWENRSFISQFLKAIAFGLFLSLLIVRIIIVVWITGLEFGHSSRIGKTNCVELITGDREGIFLA